MKILLNTMFFFILFASSVWAQEATNFSTEEIKGKFIESVTSDWKDFKVCEYYSSAEDKKKFIAKSIDPSLTVDAQSVSYQEIYVTNQESAKSLHLGIVVVSYPISNNQPQINKLIKGEGYFKNTKVLTWYILRKIESKVIIYYSETFLDAKVKKFFNDLK